MIDTDKLKPNPFDPFIVIREYVEWYPENAPAIQARGGHASIAFTVERLAEVKRLREQLAKANKYVYGICQHSDSMLMDYEDYMKGDEEK